MYVEKGRKVLIKSFNKKIFSLISIFGLENIIKHPIWCDLLKLCKFNSEYPNINLILFVIFAIQIS